MFKDIPSLYQPPPGTCFWGGGSAPDTEGMEAAAQQAAQYKMQMFGKVTDMMKPWTRAGTSAVNMLGSIYGLPGYKSIDPTDLLESTPGYKFLLDQGNKALARYGAATGLSLSGPAALSAQKFGQGTAQNYAWAPYVSGVTGLSNAGLGAVGTVGNWGINTAAGVGQDWMSAAQAEYQGQVARANQQNSFLGDIFGGLGFLGGSLLGMPGVGSAIGGAVGGLFGGGGGGFGGIGGYGSLSYPSGYTAYSSMGSPMTVPYYKAEGGAVGGNKPYVVGEKGPEVFVPNSDGFIIPNHLIGYTSHTPWAT